MSFDERYSDGSYVERNPTFHVEDSPWKARQILRILEKRNLKPKSVAEVGCGAGENLVQLAKAMPETDFSGFELSPQGYEMCREREGDRTRYFNADFFEGEDKEFDLVLCIDVLEHVEDIFSFLRKLRRRGKAFVFHIPLDMNTQMVARKNAIMSVREVVGHLHYFSKDTALAALRGVRIFGGHMVLYTQWDRTPEQLQTAPPQNPAPAIVQDQQGPDRQAHGRLFAHRLRDRRFGLKDHPAPS